MSEVDQWKDAKRVSMAIYQLVVDIYKFPK